MLPIDVYSHFDPAAITLRLLCKGGENGIGSEDDGGDGGDGGCGDGGDDDGGDGGDGDGGGGDGDCGGCTYQAQAVPRQEWKCFQEICSTSSPPY